MLFKCRSVSFEGLSAPFESRSVSFEGLSALFEGRSASFEGRSASFEGHSAAILAASNSTILALYDTLAYSVHKVWPSKRKEAFSNDKFGVK